MQERKLSLASVLVFISKGLVAATAVHGFVGYFQPRQASSSVRRTSVLPRKQTRLLVTNSSSQMDESPVRMEKVLFVEVGFGNDQHGQDPTKACVRACRNAIEFNSIPSINSIVPGGYANMKLRVQLAVPVPEEEVDVEQVKRVFPYGQLMPVEFQQGGMRASSGIELPEMGDRGDDMIIAISCVTVGY